MIHRDIKAGNILLKDGGGVRLADFGVSAQMSASQEKRETVIGTPFWMAPEVIKEVGYAHPADIWSLGIAILEMADGRPPLSDMHPMRAIFVIPNRAPPTFREPAKWSDTFKDFLSKCLQKEPEDRLTADALLEHPFITGAPATATLDDVVQEVKRAIDDKGRGLKKSKSEENMLASGDAFAPQARPKTLAERAAALAAAGSDSDSDDSDSDDDKYGTMVAAPKKATNYTPQFQGELDAAEVSKAADLGDDELIMSLKLTEQQEAAQLKAIQKKFGAKKAALQAEITKRGL